MRRWGFACSLSGYGCRGSLIANGARHCIASPLTVVGVDCGDFDLRDAFPQLVPMRQELFTVSFDRLRRVFVLEPEQSDMYVVRNGTPLAVQSPMTLDQDDTMELVGLRLVRVKV